MGVGGIVAVGCGVAVNVAVIGVGINAVSLADAGMTAVVQDVRTSRTKIHRIPCFISVSSIG